MSLHDKLGVSTASTDKSDQLSTTCDVASNNMFNNHFNITQVPKSLATLMNAKQDYEIYESSRAKGDCSGSSMNASNSYRRNCIIKHEEKCNTISSITDTTKSTSADAIQLTSSISNGCHTTMYLIGTCCNTSTDISDVKDDSVKGTNNEAISQSSKHG